jgi:hypothetical protein
MTSPIRYCVTVDTEEEWDWNYGYPTGPTSVRNIARLLEFHDLCEQTGASVTYFTNHAVLSDPTSRAIIQQLAKKPKTEIGLHIHPWNTPPLASTPTVPVRDSYLHNLPWPEQQAKLDAMLAAFLNAQLLPTSYRGGRYSTSREIQDYLRQFGLWVDCSVLPGNTWPDDGAPDYRQRGMEPVRREFSAHSVSGSETPAHGVSGQLSRPIWELPLTFGNTSANQRRGAKWLQAADSGMGRVFRLTGILDRLNIVSRCWMNFENPLGERMLRFLDVLRTLRPQFVSFTLHSSSLLPGGSPYNPDETSVQRMLARVKHVLQRVQGWSEFVPATMTEIATHLEAAHR